MTYVPPCEPSTSGREISPERSVTPHMVEKAGIKHKKGILQYEPKYNPEGLFYEENGVYHKVNRETRVIEKYGFVIGIAVNGYVVPVFNNYHDMVIAKDNDYKIQYFVTQQQAKGLGVGERIPGEPVILPESSKTPAPVKNVGNRRGQNRRGKN